jgi:hypothetical protein
MKGIVFNLLEQVVVNAHGEAAWDGLLDATGLEGTYTSLGSYPDEEIEKLVVAGSKVLGMTPDAVLTWFGRAAMPLLAQHYPVFFAPHRNARDFIVSVNSIIHPEVRKLYAGAGCPHFHFEDAADGTLLMGYNSSRRLCALAQGFVEGAGDYYGETITVEHRTSMTPQHREGCGRCRGLKTNQTPKSRA